MLNWSIEKCRDWQAIANDKDECEVTTALVFQTMSVGICWLKDEATAREFFRRVTVGERLRGVLLHDLLTKPGGEQDLKPRPITLEDCLRRVGMHSNAGSISAAKFWRQIVPQWAQDYADRGGKTSPASPEETACKS